MNTIIQVLRKNGQLFFQIKIRLHTFNFKNLSKKKVTSNVISHIAHLSEGSPMDALRMKTPPWDIQGIECAVWVHFLSLNFFSRLVIIVTANE